MVFRTSWALILAAGLLGTAILRAQELPDGKEKPLVARVCTECHSTERIISSHRTPEEWKEVVGRMVADGAALQDEDVENVVQYLAKNFGPGNVQPPAQAGSGAATAQQSAFRPVANVYQIMKSIVIPNADVVWHVAQEAPKDDNEWTAVQNSALTVAEAGNLLMIGSRSKDQGNWVKAAQALVDSATVALRAAQAKDVDALNAAGDELVRVCGSCHRQYKQSPR